MASITLEDPAADDIGADAVAGGGAEVEGIGGWGGVGDFEGGKFGELRVRSGKATRGRKLWKRMLRRVEDARCLEI